MALLGKLDLVSLQRLLLALCRAFLLVKLELLLVVGAQERDQLVVVVELALALAVAQLLLVNLHHRIDLRDLLEEVGHLLLLSLELAVFLIEIVDDPDCILVKLISVLVLSVMLNHGHIIQLTP